jgi:hypothetical protein
MSRDANDEGAESGESLRASELRRALEETGAPWSLDDEMDDEARPPEFPPGGELPPDAPPADQVEPTDFKALLSENPPADPDLARFCIEGGLLDPELALSVERPPVDRRPTPDEETPPDIEGPAPEQPRAPDDVAPPLFGERAEKVEPE